MTNVRILIFFIVFLQPITTYANEEWIEMCADLKKYEQIEIKANYYDERDSWTEEVEEYFINMLDSLEYLSIQEKLTLKNDYWDNSEYEVYWTECRTELRKDEALFKSTYLY